MRAFILAALACAATALPMPKQDVRAHAHARAGDAATSGGACYDLAISYDLALGKALRLGGSFALRSASDPQPPVSIRGYFDVQV